MGVLGRRLRVLGVSSLPPREAAGYLGPPGGRVVPAAPLPQNVPAWGGGRLSPCSVTLHRAAGGTGAGLQPFGGPLGCWGKRHWPSRHPYSSGIWDPEARPHPFKWPWGPQLMEPYRPGAAPSPRFFAQRPPPLGPGHSDLGLHRLTTAFLPCPREWPRWALHRW